MDIERNVLDILDEILCLRGRGHSFTSDTPLLGSIPELDSMAVVAIITSLEERFAFAINDDEIDGQTFATVGTLVDYLKTKLEFVAR